MSDEDKDPKDGEENAEGTGQPEKKQTTDDSDKGEKVEISKSELEKLQKKSKDFDGMVEAGKKKDRIGRTIPGAEPEKGKGKVKDADDESDDDDNDDDELTEEFATKKDLQKHIDKLAMSELQKNPFIDSHYDELLEYVHFKTGERDTIEGITAAFNRAVKGWKSDHPDYKEPVDEKEDEGKKAAAALGTDAGLGKGKEKNPQPEKKSILPKKQNMKDWYGKPKK